MPPTLRIEPHTAAADDAPCNHGRRPNQLTVSRGDNQRWRSNASSLLDMRMLQARLGVMAGRPVSMSAVIRRALAVYCASLPSSMTVAEAEAEVTALVDAAK